MTLTKINIKVLDCLARKNNKINKSTQYEFVIAKYRFLSNCYNIISQKNNNLKFCDES